MADYVPRAAAAGARTLLLVANQPPAVRIGSEVRTPFGSTPLRFRDTEAIALAILDERARLELDTNGSVETPFGIAGIRGTVTVFYGGGCHNLVFHLDSTDAGSTAPSAQSTPAHEA